MMRHCTKNVDSVRGDGRDGEAPRNWQEREAIPPPKRKGAKESSETQRKCKATKRGFPMGAVASCFPHGCRFAPYPSLPYQ